jgi:hypothetical protein
MQKFVLDTGVILGYIRAAGYSAGVCAFGWGLVSSDQARPDNTTIVAVRAMFRVMWAL